MDRDRELTRVLVEFARTLTTDYSLESILDRLVHRVADVLPVTGAGVMLMESDALLHFIAASDEKIRDIEALQRAYHEGPCLASYRSGRAVAIPDLRADRDFPRFSPAAADSGLAAVFTFPLTVDENRLGALDLYRDTSGDLDEGDLAVAQILADVAAAYLANALAKHATTHHTAELRHRSLHDALTGLPNRTLFTELVGHAVAAPHRQPRPPCAVLVVGLDRFRSVNERFGYPVGDVVLQAACARLAAALRPGDTLARLSGDEFAILCEDLRDPSVAGAVAADLTRALAEPVAAAGRSIALSASVGVAVADGDDEPEDLLQDAAFAMHAAKRAGGAGFRSADRAARVLVERRAHFEDELPSALERGEVTLAYQVICRPEDGRLVAAEALARWQHPTLGAVAPAAFIPVAEASGQILPLGRWALHRACEDFTRWVAAGAPLGHVSVNVSARQVLGAGFAATVAEVLDTTGVDPSRLHLEVTESAFLDDAPRARAVLREVREQGVRLALDDFGTGFSSLTYLRLFPFDVLKIDRSFTADMVDDGSRSTAIVASVLDLARSLGIAVVAEGVETEAHLRKVADLGCDYAQGYHLGRPLPVEAFEDLLATSPRPVLLPRATAGRAVRVGLP